MKFSDKILGEQTLKVILFDGKKKNWDVWEEKFLARAQRKGYKKVIDGSAVIPSDDVNLEPEVGDDEAKRIEKNKLQENKELNALAYSDIMLSIDTDKAGGRVAFNIIKGSKDPDKYKDGNVKIAYERLKKKYCPTSAPNLTKVYRKFYGAKFKKNGDPDVFITQMEDWRTQMLSMNHPISDEQFMVHIINLLPKAYELEVSQLEKRVGAINNPLTIEDMREELDLRYERLNIRDDDDDDDGDGEEQALYASSGFKGKCHKCGKYGHKAANCRTNKNSQKKHDNGKKHFNKKPYKLTCYNCGEEGHKAKDCPKKKSNTETANPSMETEVALVCLTQEQMARKEVWRLTPSEEEEITKQYEEYLHGKVCIYCERNIIDDKDKEGDIMKECDCLDTPVWVRNEFVWEYVMQDMNEAERKKRNDMGIYLKDDPRPDKQTDYFVMDYDDESYLSEEVWKLAGWCTECKAMGSINKLCKQCDEGRHVSLNEYEYYQNQKNYKDNDEYDWEMMMDIYDINSNEVEWEKNTMIDIQKKENELGNESVNNAYDFEFINKEECALMSMEMSDEENEEKEDNGPKMGMCERCGFQGWVGWTCDSPMCQETSEVYVELNNNDGIIAYSEPVHQEEDEYLAWLRPTSSGPRGGPMVTRHGVQWPRGDPRALPHMLQMVNPHQAGRGDAFMWLTRVQDDLRSIGVTSLESLMGRIETLNEDLRARNLEEFPPAIIEGFLQRRVSQGQESECQGQEAESQSDTHHDMAMPAITNCKLDHEKSVWLGDTGASTHMGYCDKAMHNVRSISDPVKIGNGVKLMATKVGNKKMTVVQKDGTTEDIVLVDYKYVPGLCVNLFSITQSLSNGWKIGNEDTEIWLKKGKTTIRFDKRLHTSHGVIVGIELIPREEAANIAMPALEKGATIDKTILHNMIGHRAGEVTTKVAKHYGWVLTGDDKPCEECCTAKIKQKNVNKEMSARSTTKGERFFIDISGIRYPSYGGNKFWVMALEDSTDMVWSFFVKHKDQQIKLLSDLFMDLTKQHNINIKHIRCDNAGENKTLQKVCKDCGLGINFEFTAPGTPQQNGRVERKFTTLFGMTRATLDHAGFTGTMRRLSWCEAATYVTFWHNAIPGQEGRPPMN